MCSLSSSASTVAAAYTVGPLHHPSPFLLTLASLFLLVLVGFLLCPVDSNVSLARLLLAQISVMVHIAVTLNTSTYT
jgi:hypothetical protein